MVLHHTLYFRIVLCVLEDNKMLDSLITAEKLSVLRKVTFLTPFLISAFVVFQVSDENSEASHPAEGS